MTGLFSLTRKVFPSENKAWNLSVTRISTAPSSTFPIPLSESLLVLKTRFLGDFGRIGEGKSGVVSFRSFLLVDIGLAISVGVGA